MAATLLPRSGTGRGVISLFQQPLQLSSFWQSKWCMSDWNSATESATMASGIKSYDQIPGPAPLAIIRNIWRFLPFIGVYRGMDLEQIHRKIRERYGDIARIRGLPGQADFLFVYRPEDMETTFRNEGPWPIRGGIQSVFYYRKVLRKKFYKDGVGVLTEDGPKWLETRSKVNPPMMQPRISKRYLQPISGVAQEFIERIRVLRDDKDEMPKDFINEIFKWSFESIAYIALDKRLGCLATNLPPDSEPQKMINAVGAFFDSLFYLEVGPPIWKIFPTPSWKKFVKALDFFVEVSVKYTEESIQRTKQRKAEGIENPEPSVLERLLSRMDPMSASIMAQDMIFAAVDTTSYSMAMAIYQLSKNQDKQKMLFKELKRLLPNKNDAITEEILEEMKYLRACLKESARTNPILSGIMRTTVKEIVLSNHMVPEGVAVFMSNALVLTSEEFFPKGDMYIPERWLKNKPTDSTTGSSEDFDAVSKGKRNPFAFLPFGFGPRTCVGKRFAEMEMEILLAKIVRNFRVEYNYGDMRFLSQILIKPKDPLRFKLEEREE